MKHIIPIILFCILSTPLFSDEPDKLLYEKAIYPTILVQAHKAEGTGFIIKSEKHKDGYRNVFVTCAHVIPYSFPFHRVCVPEYKNYEQVNCKIYDCYIYANDSDKDLAIGIFFSEQPMPVAEMDFSRKYRIGSKICKIGCGMEDESRVEFGHITSAKTMFPMCLGNIKFSSFTITGDSGGPLLFNNKVIGVVSAIRAMGAENPIFEIGYAVPIEEIKKINESLNINVDFAYESEKKIPSIPFTLFRVRNISEVKK